MDVTEDLVTDFAWNANFEAVQAAKREVLNAMQRKVVAYGQYARAKRTLALAARAGRPATDDEIEAFDSSEAKAANAIRAVNAARAVEEEAKAAFKAGVTAEQREAARDALRTS